MHLNINSGFMPSLSSSNERRALFWDKILLNYFLWNLYTWISCIQLRWGINNLNTKSQLVELKLFHAKLPTSNKYLNFPMDPAKRYPTERTLLLQKSKAYTPCKKMVSPCKQSKMLNLQAEIQYTASIHKIPEIVDAQTKPIHAYNQ